MIVPPEVPFYWKLFKIGMPSAKDIRLMRLKLQNYLHNAYVIYFRAVSGNRKILFAKNGKEPAILNKEQFG